MVLTPVSSAELLLAAQQLCRENPLEAASATDAESARVAAAKIVADAALHTPAKPIGISIAETVQRARAAMQNGSGAATASSAGSACDRALRRRGPSSTLRSCPYCNDSTRRFCPESGRRHESAAERSVRLWRTLYRQMQFSSRMANLTRLDKPNTCAEEFYVEI